MTPSIAILITGSEVIDGRIVDTNSYRIILALRAAGLQVREVIKVPDDLRLLQETLSYLAGRNNCVLISGGLGPTSDDLTREAVAHVSGDSLTLREPILSEIRAYFTHRGRAFDPSNTKQATFPTRAEVITNPIGTAPGFFYSLSRNDGSTCLIAALPGIPSELDEMLRLSVIPTLWSVLYNRTSAPELAPSWSARIFGLTESNVQTRLRSAELPSELIVSFRVEFPEIELMISAPSIDYSRSTQESSISRAITALGEEYIVASPSRCLGAAVHDLLLGSGVTLATAESLTAGGLGAALTSFSGSSRYFRGGFLAYHDDLKRSMLGVSAQTLDSFGAVSSEAAREMAVGARTKTESTLGISITGFAGPEGGTAQHPVGTFFVGFATPHGVDAYKLFFPNSRERNRKFSIHVALEIVRRYLLKMPIRFPSFQQAQNS